MSFLHVLILIALYVSSVLGRDLTFFSVVKGTRTVQDRVEASNDERDSFLRNVAGMNRRRGRSRDIVMKESTTVGGKMNGQRHRELTIAESLRGNTRKTPKVHLMQKLPRLAATSHADTTHDPMGNKTAFDFIVAGFPKCGTTTLLKAFEDHDETDMVSSEQCSVAAPLQSDTRVLELLDRTLSTLSSDPNMKRSFKCPTALYNYKSIARMQKHSPNAKFVIGMRHPVKMLQSFYNYRVTEIKERGLHDPIPSFDSVLVDSVPWKGVSMQSTRYEIFLMQLGKTDVTVDDMNDLASQGYDLAIKPANFTVFLYTIEQLEDSNEERSENLRKTLQSFLGLSKPIQPFGHENKNHAVGDAAHKESISICDDQWKSVRQMLVEQGARTAAWLRTHFILSHDVVVANKGHFLETLQSWEVDPCVGDKAGDT